VTGSGAGLALFCVGDRPGPMRSSSDRPVARSATTDLGRKFIGRRFYSSLQLIGDFK